ncbi:MAG: YeiH family protein [Nitrospiraceae bacterium]
MVRVTIEQAKSHSNAMHSNPSQVQSGKLSTLLRAEDWWSVWFGFILILAAVVGLLTGVPRPGRWSMNPLDAFPDVTLLQLGGLALGLGVLTAVGILVMGQPVPAYLQGFLAVFALAALAKVAGQQVTLKGWGLGYALWSLVFGLLIANTIGAPQRLLAGTRSELFIKTGLVLLGAEILAHKILALGGPGLVVAWLVTPVVVLFMWFFGTRILRISSKPLVIVISCATSVCGVSAAIAAAAASRARKEELTVAVGMTMIFTVAMMVGMPALSRALGLDQLVGGAWIGGTVDSTGAVVAAGAIFGETAEKVAAVVKMIQNILIGLIAFIIALYWVSVVERDPHGPRPSPMEIWYRFPKFIVGFLAASLLFSFLLVPALGQEQVSEILKVTKGLRGWWFALAFVAIGLESNFRQLASQLVGGKPIWLYITGQSFNILLTFLAAYLAFGGILFDRPL